MTTDRASLPTRISMGGSPHVSVQAALSSSLMAREALAMSEAPSTQKRSRPPPEPIESMLYSGPPSSIHWVMMAVESGNTVEDPAMPMSTEASTSIGETTG